MNKFGSKKKSLDENSSEKTFQISLDGHFANVSMSLARSIGYESPDEMIDRVPQLDAFFLDRSEANQLLVSIKQSEGREDRKLRILDSESKILWANIQLNPKKNGNGPIRCFEGTLEILGNPPSRSQSQPNSSTLFGDIFRAASDFSIIAVDPNGVVTAFNHGSEMMLGYSAEEVIGNRTILGFHVDSEVKAREDELKSELGHPVTGVQVFITKPQLEGSETQEWTYVRKDGSTLQVSLAVTAIRSQDNSITGYLGIAHDITERRATERTLLEREERLRGINANIPGVAFQFYAIDTGEYGIGYASERMTEIYGLASDIEGLFERFTAGIHEEDQGRFLDSVKHAVDSFIPWDFEGRFVRSSGSVFWFHGLSTPRRLDDRVVFDGLLVDITQRRLVEDALSKRIVALTRPLEDPANIAFEDLFNLDDIQRLQDEFAYATGVASIITNTEGTPITKPSRFCRLCIDIIRKTGKGRENCYRSDAVLGKLSAKGPAIQPCMSGGLWDAGAGISVGGRHIANWLIGQVRDETQTEGKIRDYAHEIGADEQTMVDAFYEVPAMSREQFERVSQALYTLANQLSYFAYQNVQQARFITERELAEERSRQSEEKLSKVFMTTPDGIAIIQMSDGQIIDVNQGFEEITGWKRRDMIGKTSEGLGFWVNLSEKDHILSELKSGRDLLHQEFRFHRHDGEERIGVYSARPINIAHKVCLVFVLQDITDRRYLEEERRKLEQQLYQSQKMDAIGQLAGGIAHDFNNILLAVSGNAKLAKMELEPQSELQENLSEIIKGCDRAADLVKQILLFSRPQGQEQRVIALSEVVNEALKLVRATIPAMIKIETDLDRVVSPIVADSSQIHQIVVNLATNAVQAIGNRSGSIRLRIDEVTLSSNLIDLPEGRYVRLVVKDDGCGMDQETCNRIFDPFFSTKAAGKGTGLGLSVVHGIVKSIGGGITIQSELDKGSEFCLYFPASNSIQIDRSRPTLSSEPNKGTGKRVLYVDDDSSLVLLVERMLRKSGYIVSGSTDPTQALSQFAAHPDNFDAVVTDLSMPGMSGFAFAKEILTIRPNLPVFMTSGYVRPDDEEQAKNVGIRSIILKPSTLEELQGLLNRLFDEALVDG